MAYKLPRRPYLWLVAGLAAVAFLSWSTIGQFETGRAFVARHTYVWQADHPMFFAVLITLNFLATLGLAIAWCILLARVLRARREGTSLPKQQE
jgi:hypothetical protein